ncbi:MAG: thiosulfate oxidation carrier protein SoxY [Salinisphaera sp.]|nr:thiosulfate oxidation carrier protein SoxY [Salinisphaera sp.]
MIDQNRRVVMKGALGFGAAGLALGTGLVPLSAWAAPDAAQWPEDAFAAKAVDKAIATLYGQGATKSNKIELQAPTIAQNGAVVPITVETSLPKVTSIALLAPKNPNALVASYEIPEGTLPYVSNRIKMAETSDIVAVVVSDGKLYRASKLVKVTIGGCGG